MPYCTEMFFALLDVNTRSSVTSVDDDKADSLPAILYIQTPCMCVVSYSKFASQRTNYNLLLPVLLLLM